MKYERKFSISIFCCDKIVSSRLPDFFSILSNNDIPTVDGWVSYLLILALINCRQRQHLCKGLLCYLNLSKHISFFCHLLIDLQSSKVAYNFFLPYFLQRLLCHGTKARGWFIMKQTSKTCFANNQLPLLSF